MSKQKNQQLQDKLTTLKKKQDRWLNERSQSLSSGTPQNTPKTGKSSNIRTTPVRPSLNGNIKAKPETVLWNTNSKSASYSGFVVRRKNSGADTSRSNKSNYSHSSLKTKKSPRLSTKSEHKFVKSFSSRLDTEENFEIKKEDENYDHTKYELENNSVDQSMPLFESTFADLSFNKKINGGFMKNHFCTLCNLVMVTIENAPQIVYPCGHSFCLSCLNGQIYCPSPSMCNCKISSIEPNEAMRKVIKSFQQEQNKKEQEEKEAEAKKYIDEYNSLNTRTKVMKDEATGIIDQMEDITHELVQKKKSIEDINKSALEMKEQMKSLQKHMKSLEQFHIKENDSIIQLESEYENNKKQLVMVEKTLKTLAQSKDRVKYMVANIAPSIRLGDFSD